VLLDTTTLRDLVREVVREEIRAALRDGAKGTTSAAPANNDSALWDVAGASSFLGVSTSWVYHRAAAGTIPCIRVGHNLRFDPEALRAWARGERRGGRVVPLK
jgi:excisionase family DNA binding protein